MKNVAEKGSTLILRLAIICLAFAVVGLCILILPPINREWASEFPQMTYAKYPVIAGFLSTAIIFFVALHQAWKLLGYIDRNKAFSRASVKSLNIIKYCAVAISIFYMAGLPIIYQIAQDEDAPGLILMYSAIFIGIPLAVAVFIAVAKRLLSSAIAIKSENDLTV